MLFGVCLSSLKKKFQGTLTHIVRSQTGNELPSTARIWHSMKTLKPRCELRTLLMLWIVFCFVVAALSFYRTCSVYIHFAFACVFGRILSCTFSSLTFHSIVLLDFCWLRSCCCFFFFILSFPFRMIFFFFFLYFLCCFMPSCMLASSEPKPLTATVHTQQSTTKYLSLFSTKHTHNPPISIGRLLSVRASLIVDYLPLQRNNKRDRKSTILLDSMHNSSEPFSICDLLFVIKNSHPINVSISKWNLLIVNLLVASTICNVRW